MTRPQRTRPFMLAASLAACTPAATPTATPTTPPPVAETPPPAPPEPTEPDEPAAVAPTAPTGPAKFPATVFAARIGERKDWIVDMIDLGSDTAALQRRLEAEGDGGIIENFKPGDPALPAGFAVGDPWTLISRTGAEPHTATSFGALLPGSGTIHFEVRLGRAGKAAKGPALALRGHVTTTAKLVAPPPVRPATLARDALPRIVQAVTPQLVPEIRDIVPQVKFTEADVKLYPGRFPGGRSHVGFLVARAPGEEFELMPVSGLVFAYPDGRVEFFATAVTWGTATLIGLVDLDGDNLDEVVYDDSYFEGAYVQLIHWTGDKPATRTLTGDGV